MSKELAAEIKGLSPRAARFLRRHPEEAILSINAALEAAAALESARRVAPLNGVPDAVRPFVKTEPYGAEIISSTEAAKRLDVTRPTVHSWVTSQKLIGWAATKRGLKLPAEQIIGPGKVVEGIDRVLEVIPDPELACSFLDRMWPFEEGEFRPIEKLRNGDVDDVLEAAKSFGYAFT